MARRSPAPRLEFEAAAIYQYPEHLRPWLDELPTQPGVYLFHGDSDAMPLYIGKSVNKKPAMLRQARRISWQPAAGELGALLLEARLIKEMQPLFNKRLRRNKQLCSLQLNDDRPLVVYAREVNFALKENLFGLFANRRAALEALKSVADEQKLCYSVMGLEPLNRGRACFRSSLGRCAGACCGREALTEHNQRLRDAMAHLQLVCWPWPGAVALEEKGETMTQFHIVNNWLWLGAVASLTEASTLTQLPDGFDQDGYKILCRPMLSGKFTIHELFD
ncbi:excinuclease Cho [Trabulsiella odontotermitis]|uniref:excinuclease Cho n=1 Tax=Trabulsiella odontotermitis TaxID=379893 RepID=UPI000676462D|nr:excinuclease Cho [Trabulsiella odontotermitis]